MRTGIIIVNYKTPWHLRECLKSVFEHTEDFKIYLVHNAPDAESLKVGQEFKERYPHHIEIFINEENKGYVGGANTAYPAVLAHEFICLLNSDIIVTAKWMSEMVRVMDENPQVSQTCPDTNNHYPDPKLWAIVKRLPVIGKYMHKLQLQLGQAPRNPEQSDFVPVDSFTLYPGGYCNLLRSKYFKDLGYLMDPNIIHGYWDDFDLGMYMRQFGQVGGVNRSYVFHFLNTSFNLLSESRRKFKHRLTFLNGMYCMDKWSKEIKAEMATKSPMELIDMSESHVMQAALQYLGLAQDPKFVEFIRSIPAREVWEAK